MLREALFKGGKLICGDNRNVVPQFQNVPLIVTSPPYDDLRYYDGMPRWDFEVFKEIAEKLVDCLAPGGVIVWVTKDAKIKGGETLASFKQAIYFVEWCGMLLHDTMIFYKSGTPFTFPNRYRAMFDYMFVFSKGKPRTAHIIKDEPSKMKGRVMTGRTRNVDGTMKQMHGARVGKICNDFHARGNVWKYNVGAYQSTHWLKAFEHPATFPERLAYDHIVTWSNPGEYVLDPFMGSGTVAVAALQAGRKFLGVEQSERYFDLACERIEDYEAGKVHVPQRRKRKPVEDTGQICFF